MYDYWKKQTIEKPLFPDIEWNKPERKSSAGRLGIIGGNKLGLLGVTRAYEIALKAGLGEARVLLPDVLKKQIPAGVTDTIFAPGTPVGSLSKQALPELKALAEWSQGLLLIGDAGRNSETAVVYEQFIDSLINPPNDTKQIIITRDAVDLLMEHSAALVERPNTILVLSFAQAQKLFRSVYYPKILTFSMALAQLVETLHKFTITYPVTLVVFHDGFLVAAHDGNITTTPLDNPMGLWRGDIGARVASYYLWNHSKPLEAATAALI